jgi:type I restriction enzyme S subunit
MKEKAKTLTPKLRFPEFKGGPRWEEAKLGDVISTITPPKKLPTSSYRTKGSIPIVDQSPELVCGWTDDAEAVIESSQPLIVFGDHTCVLKLVRGPFAQGADGIKIFHSEPFIDTEYLFHNLSNRPLVMEDYKRHFSILKERRIHYPDPRTAEQRKIAACLTSLDEWIDAEGRKLEALRAHKKGLMQKLFPREGETRPRLRFPEFRHGAAWVTVPIGEMFETMSGGTPDRTKEEYWGGTVPWITTSLVDFNVIREAEEFITEAGLQNSAAKVFPKGTVLVAMYGQGKTRGKVAMLDIEATTNQACAAILPANGFDPAFTFLSLSGRYDEMRSLSNAGGQENLSQALIRELPFHYPNDPAERARIAACLSSLDALIAAQSRKLEGLRAHKKSLMQQLFPSPEGV